MCAFVRYYPQDLAVKGPWADPEALDLPHPALSPLADLRGLQIVSGVRIVTDLTRGLGVAVYDYLKD